MADSQAKLQQAIYSTPMSAPRIPVYSNINALPYDSGGDSLRSQLSQHLLTPVEFARQIDAFIKSLERGEDYEVSGVEGLKTLRLTAAAYESIQTGLPVEL